jgi:predicted phage tail protein
MGFWTIAAIAASIISGGASYVQAKKAAKIAKRAAKQGQGLLINSDGTNNFIPVIYGTRRIAGTRVFVATGDDPVGEFNGILYLVYVLCEGEVDAITDILIDDLPTSDARFAYSNSVLINTFLGTDVQTADADFIAADIGWTSEHRLKGLAYITVRLKWNSNAFSSIPNITALVRGKKVYDTRTATTAYSTNPALCIRDYLTNNRYGKGLAAGSIDDSSISAAATFYDNTVTFWTSGTVGKLFEFNAVIDTEQKIIDNLKDMLFCCRGFLPYTNGVYQLIPDKSASSVFAFTTSNIVSGISIRGESKEDKYNKVILTFTDPDNSFQENTAIFPDASDTSYLVADNNVELVGDFELPCITNYYAARDLARVFLLRSRNALRCAFNANSDALNLSVGDVVTVTHPTPGFSAKPFQVEELTINYDGTCRVSLLEYDSSIYTYDPASEQLSYPDTDLPNPYSIAAPTSFVVTETTYLSSDGTLVPEIKITWTASADAFVDYYEFEFKKSADTAYQSAIAYQPVYVNTFGVIGTTYNIRVRAVNSLGVTSSFLTSSYTVVGDTTAPAIPTTPTIVGDYNQVTATWSAATEKDYKESWVYQNTTGTTPSLDPAINAPFRKVTGNTVTVSGLAPSTTYYVWVRNVDFSDNRSGFSTAGTFTTTAGIISSEIADNAVTTAKINGSAVTDVKIAANAVTTEKINALAVTAAKVADSAIETAKIAASAVDAGKLASNAVTTDKINALAVTAAKVAASAIETSKIADLAVETGKLANAAATEAKIAANAITETKISDNAITTPKLIAGAVTAAKITAGTITANEIAASTITGAKIAAGTLTAGNIAALTITAGEIAADAITTDKILANAITAAKIAASTITANEIAASTITGAKIAAGTITAGNIQALTITASEIASNAITAGKILAGEITGDKISSTFTTTSNLVLTTNGKLYTDGKTSAASAAGGVFLGHDGASNYDFAVGDSTNSIVWDGSAGTFTITGEVIVLGSLKADSAKTFDGSNFMYELGTATTISGYSGASILRTQKTTSFALGTITTGSNSFALAGQSTNAAGAGYGGAFVNSTASGGTSHRTEAYLTNSSQSGLFLHTSSTNQAILGNATYAGNFTGNVNVTGNITATGTITPFTGSHDGVLDNAIEPELGDILVDVSVIAKESVNDTLTRMALSSAANQCAIGVYSGNREDTYLPLAISEPGDPIVVTPYTSIPGDRVLRPEYAHLLDDSRIIGCNSVGEGQINVCGESGNISAGDLIVTSSMAGKGMKQADDIIRAKTVAKARESITFTDPTQVKMIACIYLCG